MQTGSNTEGCIATDGTYCWVALRQSNAINLWSSTLMVKFSALQLKNQSFPTKRHAPKKRCCQCCLSLFLSHLMSFPPWHHHSIWLHAKPGSTGMPERFTCSLQIPTFFLWSTFSALECPGELSSQLVVEYSHLGHPASLARSSASSRAFLASSCLKYVV